MRAKNQKRVVVTHYVTLRCTTLLCRIRNLPPLVLCQEIVQVLAMRDERSPYFYLPGGRVQMGEAAEHAVVREVKEELNIIPKIIRPLWLNQSFFTEDVDKLNYHEIYIYYLVDISGTGLLDKGEQFTLYEGDHIHDFEWLAFERLQDEYFYPIFLKTDIFNLLKHFEIRAEYE